MRWLVVVALAGCASLPAAEPPATSLSFHACSDLIGHFASSWEDAEEAVPPPLQPRRYLGEDAQLGWQWVIAAACEGGPGPFLLSTFVVDAPTDWRPQDGFMVMATVAAGDEALAAWWQKAGGRAHAQDVEYAVDDGAVQVGRATGGGVRLDVLAAAPEEVQDADHVRVFFVADGAVAGAFDWAVTESRERRGPAVSGTEAGVGGHYWGADYDYRMLPVDLSG